MQVERLEGDWHQLRCADHAADRNPLRVELGDLERERRVDAGRHESLEDLGLGIPKGHVGDTDAPGVRDRDRPVVLNDIALSLGLGADQPGQVLQRGVSAHRKQQYVGDADAIRLGLRQRRERIGHGSRARCRTGRRRRQCRQPRRSRTRTGSGAGPGLEGERQPGGDIGLEVCGRRALIGQRHHLDVKVGAIGRAEWNPVMDTGRRIDDAATGQRQQRCAQSDCPQRHSPSLPANSPETIVNILLSFTPAQVKPVN